MTLRAKAIAAALPLAMLLTACDCIPSRVDDSGRYQMERSPEVLKDGFVILYILDTRTGKLWTYVAGDGKENSRLLWQPPTD